jgi:DNA-binding transcriptional regulator YdaS (Cro superfamily)
MRQVKIKQNHSVFDYIRDRHGIRSDLQLARMLDVMPPEISKIRSGVREKSPAVALAVHEVFGLTFAEMRSMSPCFVGVEPVGQGEW